MATINVAINGFGRIGRIAFRIGLLKHAGSLEFGAINTSGSMPVSGWAHLTNFDTMYRKFQIEIETEEDSFGVRWIKAKEGKRAPYVMLVPLMEIISEAEGVGVGSKQVLVLYEQLINSFGTEFAVLLETEIDAVEKIAGERIADGIKKVRSGDIVIEPGYDGVFGKVKIWKEEESPGVEEHPDQTTLF